MEAVPLGSSLLPLAIYTLDGSLRSLFFTDLTTACESNSPRSCNEKHTAAKGLIVSDPPTPLMWTSNSSDIFPEEMNIFSGLDCEV